VIVDKRSYNYYQSDCAANSAYRFVGVFYFCFTFSALQPRAVVTNYISRDLGERDRKIILYALDTYPGNISYPFPCLRSCCCDFSSGSCAVLRSTVVDLHRIWGRT
jgi:hypothetical protein